MTTLTTILNDTVTPQTAWQAKRLIKSMTAAEVRQAFQAAGFPAPTKKLAVAIIDRMAVTYTQCELIK